MYKYNFNVFVFNKIILYYKYIHIWTSHCKHFLIELLWYFGMLFSHCYLNEKYELEHGGKVYSKRNLKVNRQVFYCYNN